MPSILLTLFLGIFSSAAGTSKHEQQFAFVMKKMSAPLQGVDELDDFDIIGDLPIQLKPLPINSKGRSWLKKYALTSYGSKMFSLLINNFNNAVSHGYLSASGALTQLGKEAIRRQKWMGPFVIAGSAGQATGSSHSVQIPENYDPHFFPIGDEAVDPLALIHHEFGHTHFSSVKSENREHLAIEREVVQLYENPVRLLNKFSERKIYFDNFNTLSIPSGNVYPGPAFIFFNTDGELTYQYFYNMTPDGIKVLRDLNGKGLINTDAILNPIRNLGINQK